MRDTGMTNGQQANMRQSDTNEDGDVVLGDDWIAPEQTVPDEMQAKRAKRGFFTLRGSPLTRKIMMFNVVALFILVGGILYLNSPYQNLAIQRAGALVAQAGLVANVFEAQVADEPDVSLAAGDSVDVQATLNGLTLRGGVEVFVFDSTLSQIARVKGVSRGDALNLLNETPERRMLINDTLTNLWGVLSGKGTEEAAPSEVSSETLSGLIKQAYEAGAEIGYLEDSSGGTIVAATTQIVHNGAPVGVVAVTSPTGEIDRLVRGERERVLQIFVVALLVSVGLSLVLASTIANPLADLAEAAELGRARNSSKVKPGRIRIPDLSARPDEIGRLSRALRGMVKALYNRIDSNEQFAADVSHEIKNPLASLQSAVGTLRMVKRDDQREKLMDVIEHDVRRLDRLVSDISNASRLDAELVKEEEESFDLVTTLGNLNQFLGEDARSKGIDYITELPKEAIVINGLEARLAQVFVNLITNAISFCEEGDAIRVWARRRDSRVLIVVEDTGPGIPDQALTKVFKRFYSQRPEEHFGNNSGLGLAISKQIVEAHGGVIWAENIRPTEADLTSEPLGARFVVGLPV